MKKISAVIPMYYEEQVAEECYKRVIGVLERINELYDSQAEYKNVGGATEIVKVADMDDISGTTEQIKHVICELNKNGIKVEESKA